MYYVILGIVALFIITNPGIASFKAFVGSNTYAGLHRTGQFFICSTYQRQGKFYLGILGNFWDITYQPKVATWQPPVTDKPVDTKKVIIVGKTDSGLPIFKQVLSKKEFAMRIKAKYPEYSNMNNDTLVKKILAKYPVYKNEVELN